MSHENFGIKSSHYSYKAKDGFISVSQLKKNDKLLFAIEDDEGDVYEKQLIISKVKKLKSGEVQIEFSNFSIYEPYEFRKNDFVSLV